MGNGASGFNPAGISNVNARTFFETLAETQQHVEESTRKQKAYKNLFKMVYESLKRIPEKDEEISLMITGQNLGPTFIYNFMNTPFPSTLTKVSLRKSSLTSSHARNVAHLLSSLPALKQFDASENAFNEGVRYILSAAIGHKNLQTLMLEQTGATENIVEVLTNVIQTSRSLESLTVSPAPLPKDPSIQRAVQQNNYMKTLSISQDSLTQQVCERNSLVAEIVDTIVRSPFQRQFRTKVDSFKSVRGKAMLEGRARQKMQAKGTELFANIESADERARTTEVEEKKEGNDLLRSGMAEMVGRRPSMEDVSIVLKDMPIPGAMMFGLFDGHGGREAAEYASQNLPHAISNKLLTSGSWEDAYVSAYRQLQMDMKPWCMYVGTTSVLASVENRTLTVANTGDSRCVLCRDGTAVRLSIDHKPDLPEETEYITSKGSYVQDNRVGGMLAVSRALGDGFLGDAVNSTPALKQIQLNENDTFMILACDGVWDVMTDQEACDLIASEIDPLVAAKKLRDTAFEKGSLDNISVIVIFLGDAFSNTDAE